MKNKKIFLFVSLLILFSMKLKADEGMWLPLFIDRLNYVDMQKMGCHLTADEIYSVNHSSIKDAIACMNGGNCTGEIVSSEGLMMTAHHCGIDYIQNHSTLEKDYLENGFWAMSKAEELRNDKLMVSFLIRMEDVSGKILPFLNDKMTKDQRQAMIDSLSAKLEKEATDGSTYEAVIESFYNGNEFFLFVTETYKDVRLVGAPPASIGEFGGETDNWMWPRHVADFSFFRIYTGPDGKPAGYSKKNIPYKSKYYFPISMKGVKENDFQLIMGYPGETDRFMTSFGIKEYIDKYCTPIVKNREKRIAIMTEAMKSSEEIKIKYTSEFSDVSNFYKFFKGMMEQLQDNKIYDQKTEIEKKFTTWYNSDPKLKEKYGNVLQEIKTKYDSLGKYTYPTIMYGDGVRNAIKMIPYIRTFENLDELLKNISDRDTINKLTQSLTYTAKQYFRDFDLQTDKKMCLAMFQMIFSDLDKEFYPDFFASIDKKYKGSISAYVDELYEKSLFADKDKVFEFLINPDYKKLEKDIGYITMQSIYSKSKSIRNLFDNAEDNLEASNRLFLAGLLQMNKDKKNYPDADGTLRYTYGKVGGYTSAGKKYNYYTTLDELIAKEDTSNSEFTVPSKLKELYKSKDFGNYTTDGVMRVCYITDNDCTGGNSGSPVINGDGEITGILFDGNWESLSNDIAYNVETQRSLCMDIKFVLFLIDKYGGATNIIKELTLKE
jgi:hypothetical protein